MGFFMEKLGTVNVYGWMITAFIAGIVIVAFALSDWFGLF